MRRMEEVGMQNHITAKLRVSSAKPVPVYIRNGSRTMGDGAGLRDGVIIRKLEPQMRAVGYWEVLLELLELEGFTEYSHSFGRALILVIGSMAFLVLKAFFEALCGGCKLGLFLEK